jgi:toxin ParE1/3/4
MTLDHTSQFKEDVISTLERTVEFFGSSAKERYARLINVALEEITKDPLLRGSREAHGVRLYHLRHSKKNAAVDGISVKNPRHFVAYRVSGEVIEVLRLLHDSRDIESHLPDGE